MGRRCVADIAPYSTGGPYVNLPRFADDLSAAGPSSPAIEAARQRYDPEGLFAVLGTLSQVTVTLDDHVHDHVDSVSTETPTVDKEAGLGAPVTRHVVIDGAQPRESRRACGTIADATSVAGELVERLDDTHQPEATWRSSFRSRRSLVDHLRAGGGGGKPEAQRT